MKTVVAKPKSKNEKQSRAAAASVSQQKKQQNKEKEASNAAASPVTRGKIAGGVVQLGKGRGKHQWHYYVVPSTEDGIKAR